MAKDRPPSFQFYPRDFASDPAVVCMSLEARGAYIMLLCAGWLMAEPGVIPAGQVQRLAGAGDEEWRRISSQVAAAFDVTDTTWTQKRMVAERASQQAFREHAVSMGLASASSMTKHQRVERAKAAAAARWGRNRSGDANLMLTNANTASSSASAVEEDSKARLEAKEQTQDLTAVVNGLAKSMSLAPRPRARIDPEAIGQKLAAEPPGVAKVAMIIANKLDVHRVPHDLIMAVVDHYLSHQGAVQNPHAYYAFNSEGFKWVEHHHRRAQDQADWDREKAEDSKRWPRS